THRVAPRADRTYGDIAADFAADYGLAPDRWQRGILDDWLAERGSRWASLTCGLAVPRQNGKNALIEIRELFGMVGRGERILHTAHEVKTAQKHFRRLKYFFGSKKGDPGAKFPELNALVESVRNVNGQEGIFLTNGGSVELVARSKNSGRGFTVDVLVIDEAQEMDEDALEALLPTTSAAPTGNPQWIYTGTPPGPEARGEVFSRVRREALGDKRGRFTWSEWAWDGRGSLDDRLLWRRLNPGGDAGRLQMSVIEGERSRFSDDGFARERLGRWSESSASTLFPRSAWMELVPRDENGDLLQRVSPPAGVRSYGVKFSPDGATVALSVAVRPAGGGPVFVEAIEHASLAMGTSELVSFCAERWRDALCFVVDGKAHAGAFVQALIDAGVPKPRPGKLENSVIVDLSTRSGDVVAAHSAFLELFKRGGLTHAGQEGLADSVACAARRPIGTTGGWGLQSVSDTGDVTPVESVILAVHGVLTSKRMPGQGSRAVLLT